MTAQVLYPTDRQRPSVVEHLLMPDARMAPLEHRPGMELWEVTFAITIGPTVFTIGILWLASRYFHIFS